jgi:PAS domain-containing protein
VAQEPIELILLKHWASYMATPIWIMDAVGDLLFYNEPAEQILGRRFDEAGAINSGELAELFETTDLDGSPLENKALPVVVALAERVPAHRELRFRTLDHEWREIEITALPVVGQGGRLLGAMALFWEPST